MNIYGYESCKYQGLISETGLYESSWCVCDSWSGSVFKGKKMMTKCSTDVRHVAPCGVHPTPQSLEADPASQTWPNAPLSLLSGGFRLRCRLLPGRLLPPAAPSADHAS